ncbi:MAG: hypothetical protein NVS3B24_01660 [Candidatus Dormibacteria bacterium]
MANWREQETRAEPKRPAHTCGRAWLGPLVLAPLVALAGCGAASTGSAIVTTPAQGSAAASPTPPQVVGSSAAPAACDLLSQQDAQASVGQTLVPDPSNEKSSSCNYVSTDNLGYGVSVTLGSWDSLMTEAGDAPHVSGVGDDALTHDGIFLYVRKGTRGFVLNMRDHSTSPEARLARAKELALKLLPRFK